MSKKEYKPTIGLEIHAELNTKTKMFCDSKNDPNEIEPNKNICPVCTADPGTLPVINKEAVKRVIKVGVALGGNIATFTEFDRKNYFYPDIPKGYQISQYKYPIVSGGTLLDVDITRVHLEEDTARSAHISTGSVKEDEHSLVDFNRAGVPLMELVTEPVIHSAKEAGDFARALQLLLKTLDVSDANMEKGEMRVEANISVSDSDGLGIKVEIKNLNSFKVVEKAIAYEIKRQIEVLENKGELVQETRGWDEEKEKTFSQRKKEGSKDYRYFPEPDLPKLRLDLVPEFDIEKIKKELPELPTDKRKRYKELGIKDEDIEVYVTQPGYAVFFENIIQNLSDKNLIQLASNYITSDLTGLLKDDTSNSIDIKPSMFAKLINMIEENTISSRGAKNILKIMVEEGGDPEEIATANNFIQNQDEDLLKIIIDGVIKDNQSVVDDYKSGKENAIKFLIGQGMKETKGSADPKILEKLIKKAIN